MEEILHYLTGRNRDAAAYDLTAEHPGEYLLIYAWMAELERNGEL